jgi:DNA polymerase gamma 1
VQLFSRPLHAQIFLNAEFPLPFSIGMRLSESHLQSHDLDNSQAQWLPNLSFRLPPLEGPTIGTHFWNIGSDIAAPSNELAKGPRPPLPEDDVRQLRQGERNIHAQLE